ncbi:MAG TPA: DUF5642 family protein [Mycobacterium sp.]|nr:DUF5642 family protein [Mycobacterium sp.]HUB54574.1 DUF5642 family protein [Mycobacterium sp.]
MRLHVAVMFVILPLLASCAHARQTAPAPSSISAARHINPGNIRWVRRELPPGYEVTGLLDQAAPPAVWGLGADAAASPARCAALADPAGGHGQSAQGISGSGAGGIVYAVIAAAPTGPVALDQSLVNQCHEWTMTSRRATARVHLVDPPRIDGAETLGMAADITTSAEGGNEIGSRANTFTAYLGDCYAFTTVISDPGSPDSPLTPQFAANLLVKVVSALRA